MLQKFCLLTSITNKVLALVLRSYFESGEGGGGGLTSDSKWGGRGGGAENTFFSVSLISSPCSAGPVHSLNSSKITKSTFELINILYHIIPKVTTFATFSCSSVWMMLLSEVITLRRSLILGIRYFGLPQFVCKRKEMKSVEFRMCKLIAVLCMMYNKYE